jgi:uncharacterized membrane protein YdjX (TVP38/TMEM64 family)
MKAPAPKRRAESAPKKRFTWVRPVVLIVVIVALFVAFRVLGVERVFQEVRAWISGLGPWGPVVFVGIYILATVAVVPGSALSIAAGALFGSVVGVTVVIVGATVGASLSFLISRYVARDAVAQWLSTKERFKAIDRMTEEHGAVIVALTRLVPIFPFNLLNYGFGLTGVRFWTYVLWSFLCMIPGIILYVVGADALYQAVIMGKVPWALVGTLAAVFVLLTMLVRYARRSLNEKEGKAGEKR